MVPFSVNKNARVIHVGGIPVWDGAYSAMPCYELTVADTRRRRGHAKSILRALPVTDGSEMSRAVGWLAAAVPSELIRSDPK